MSCFMYRPNIFSVLLNTVNTADACQTHVGIIGFVTNPDTPCFRYVYEWNILKFVILRIYRES